MRRKRYESPLTKRGERETQQGDNVMKREREGVWVCERERKRDQPTSCPWIAVDGDD